MSRALKYTLVTLLVLGSLAFVLVYGLYFKGARDISPAWGATTATYPDAARVALWRWYGGEGLPQADPMSPPEYAWRSYHARRGQMEGRPGDSGLNTATGAARRAEMAREGGGMGGYHLMQFAAAIQASGWSAESQLDTVLEQQVFGAGARGFRAGALRVFGTPVESLDTAQLWVLLAIAHGPGYFDPWCHRDRLHEFAVKRAEQRNARLAPAAIDAALDSVAPAPPGHACKS